MDETEKLIEEVARKASEATIERLIERGVIRENRKSAEEKTISLLKRYELFRLSDDPDTLKQVAQIDVALEQIRSDHFYAIIPMCYFEQKKIWEIADYFGVAERTIIRKRDELVRKISCVLCSNDVIKDLLT